MEYRWQHLIFNIGTCQVECGNTVQVVNLHIWYDVSIVLGIFLIRYIVKKFSNYQLLIKIIINETCWIFIEYINVVELRL